MEIYVDIHKKLEEFDLIVEFQGNGTIGLLGASGCGKSMTLKSIAGIEKPDSGIIKINGRTVFDSEKGIDISPQKRNVGFVFQNYALFPHMTVFDNIAFGMAEKNKEQKVRDIGEKIEILNLLERYPIELSGGQQQRVAIARALSREPEVLLLDEPFSALDTYLKMNLEEWLQNLIKDFNGPVVFVSHNIDEVSRICDAIVMLSKGKVIEAGASKKVLHSPKHLEAAIVSGCRNISKISYHNETQIKAIDWDITLNVNKPMPKEIKYVGIHSYDIIVGLKSTDSVPCQVKDIKDGVGFIELHLVPLKGNKTIYVEVTRREFEEINLSDFVYIYIPQEKVMFLK